MPESGSPPRWWANLARRREHYAQLHEQAKRWGVEVISLREENERLRGWRTMSSSYSPRVAEYLRRMAPTQSHALRREFLDVARSLDPPRCKRCGGLWGAGGHGPGFCTDRKESL